MQSSILEAPNVQKGANSICSYSLSESTQTLVLINYQRPVARNRRINYKTPVGEEEYFFQRKQKSKVWYPRPLARFG